MSSTWQENIFNYLILKLKQQFAPFKFLFQLAHTRQSAQCRGTISLETDLANFLLGNWAYPLHETDSMPTCHHAFARDYFLGVVLLCPCEMWYLFFSVQFWWACVSGRGRSGRTLAKIVLIHAWLAQCFRQTRWASSHVDLRSQGLKYQNWNLDRGRLGWSWCALPFNSLNSLESLWNASDASDEMT